MDSSLTIEIAPLGCFSGGRGLGTIQRATQSYIHSAVHLPGAAERKAIVRQILSSERDDRRLRAAVEVHFYRTLRVQEWHILRDELKSAKVSEFILNVRAAAQGIMEMSGQKGSRA